MLNTYVGRIVVLVRDYERTKEFYAKNFGFEVLFEQTTHDGTHFLHMGTKEPVATGLWFIKADGENQEALVGRQTAEQPLMVFYTNSLQDLAVHLTNNDVKIIVGPVISPDYSYLHCLDLYGNEIIVAELNSK